MRVRKAKPRPVPESERCNTLFMWKNTFRTDGILLGPFPGAVLPTSPVRGPRKACEITGLTDRGLLRVVAADPQGYREMQSLKVADAPVWAHLAVAHNRIFPKDKSHLSCLALEAE